MSGHSVTQSVKRSTLLAAALILSPLGAVAQGPPGGGPPAGDPPGAVVPQLVITGAEVFGSGLCENPCDGILLVSGRNLGDVAPFAGTVALFLPTMGEQILNVVAFDPVAQNLAAELPVGTLGTPGTFLLTVTTGASGTETDVFEVALAVTGVVAGPGLTGGGKAGELTLGVDFQGSGAAATVARSDHNHPGEDIVSGTVAEPVIDAALTRDSEVAGIVAPQIAMYVDELLVGSVLAFAMETPPAGWLECDGQEVSRTTYARLFDRIGVAFGAGDYVTTFNLPDLRGLFVRGWDHGRGWDPHRDSRWNYYPGGATGDHVGSNQWHHYSAHSHTFEGATFQTGHEAPAHRHTVYNTLGYHDPNPFVNREEGILLGMVRVDLNRGPLTTASSPHSHSFNPRGSVGFSGTYESRPKNINLMFCIKY